MNPSTSSGQARRHDIDALRVLAFGLVILYHVAMYYVPGWGWHLKSPDPVAWLPVPMRALNLWRLDLLFVVSGLAIALLRRGNGSPAALAKQRSWRLLLPLAFGMLVVVPYQPYAQGVANGLVEPGFGRFLVRYFTRSQPWPAGAFDGWEAGITWNHLWYLAYLWFYTVLLVLLMPLLESTAGRRLRDALLKLRGAKLLVLPVLPLLVASLLLWPRFPVTHDLIHDGWVHVAYFTLFLYGYWIGLDAGFWAELTRLRWKALGAAVLLLAVLMSLRAALPDSPALRQLLRCMGDFYLWAAIVAVLGWAHHKLNKPWPWLAWASEAVFPWYVLHQTLIIVLVVQLAPLGLGPVLEPALLVAGTALGCLAITALVRRVRWLRPLFGLKPVPAAAASSRAPTMQPRQLPP
ncbi:MAG: acyltransferase family protein [Pseudomonadota bacterium]